MKSPAVDKNIMLSPSLCGRFALGNLSKTYIKDVGFGLNVFSRAADSKLKQCSDSEAKHSKSEPEESRAVDSKVKQCSDSEGKDSNQDWRKAEQ